MIKCSICKKKSKLYKKDSFLECSVYYCSNCDYYFNDTSKIKDISKYYSKYYWGNIRKVNKKRILLINNLSKFYLSFTLFFNIPPVEFNSNLKILNRYFKIKKNMNFLEIGTGTGRNLFYLTKKGIKVNGVEPDKFNSNKINKKLNKLVCFDKNYEDVKFRQKFDIIYLRHVFEHFVELNIVINKFKQDLKKDGILYINVPNAKNSWILNHSIVNHPHTFHFSIRSLVNLFENNGFEVVYKETYNHKIKGLKIIVQELLKKSILKQTKQNNGDFIVIILKLKNKII